MPQNLNQEQQVLQSLHNLNNALPGQVVATNIENAKVDAIGLVIILTAITVIRFFIRRKRLEN